MTTLLSPQLQRISADLPRSLLATPMTGALLAGTIALADYVFVLSQIYWYTRETSPLLREAAAGLRAAGRYPDLAIYYEQKATEESGHELWALADLRALGACADPALLPPPSPAVVAYLAWHRGLIRAGKPLGFFGAAWVLEALGSGSAGAVVERLRARDDIPGIAGALRFLGGHGAADVGHLAELAERLACVVEPEDCRTILVSAHVTAALYPRFFTSGGEAPATKAA